MSEGKPSEGDTPPPLSNNDRLPSDNQPSPVIPQDRTELLSRARTFLLSPQIIHQDTLAKRKFLTEKGLDEGEINLLLHEQKPGIPPRTYPQPPPSNLPTLLLGLTRLFSWIAGSSAFLIFIYRRFLLPRIIRTTMARHSIKSHHLSLLRKLTTSLASLKESQAESYAKLPRPEPYQELPHFSACHSIADILTVLGDKNPDTGSIPPITLIRCGLEEYGRGKEGDLASPTTEELFQYLESQIPWLISDAGLKYEQSLWETLLSIGTPSIPASSENLEDRKPTRWTYTPPAPADPYPILKSITALSARLPKKSLTRESSSQHTLQSLSDFTGYITTQVYMPYRAPSSTVGFLNTGSILGPAEEEFKREIRALKGLVLNRRSFMPTIRPGVSPPPS